MPRVKIAAAAALLCVGLAGAVFAQGAGTKGDCPSSARGPRSYLTYYPPGTIPIIYTPKGLKPAPTPLNNGLCIDTNGEIYLYASGLAFAAINFYVDPSIGKFDPNDLDFDFTAAGQDFALVNLPSGDGQTLYIFPAVMSDGSVHTYLMHIHGRNGKTRRIEPGVHNH